MARSQDQKHRLRCSSFKATLKLKWIPLILTSNNRCTESMFLNEEKFHIIITIITSTSLLLPDIVMGQVKLYHQYKVDERRGMNYVYTAVLK